jgi:hypothetical protein
MSHTVYQSPTVIQVTNVLLERDFLDASITPTVESVGQEVVEKDFSAVEFNHEWGE